MSEDKTGKTLERRVAAIYRALGARAKHDVPMAGHQIDVYAETSGLDGSLHRIAVEAKDYQSPVGINVVSKWALVVDNLRRAGLVDEGIIVSPVGFTKPAREAVAEHVRRGLPTRLLELADLEASVAQTSASVDLDRLREEYLAFLVSTYHRLNFRGIVQTKNPVELDLADVYVSLNVAPSGGGRAERPCEPEEMEVLDEATLRERAERAERLRIEDVLRKEPRLVVLGDPGAGKTTWPGTR